MLMKIGFILMLIGGMSMDSEPLIIPVTITAIGVAMMFIGVMTHGKEIG